MCHKLLVDTAARSRGCEKSSRFSYRATHVHRRNRGQKIGRRNASRVIFPPSSCYCVFVYVANCFGTASADVYSSCRLMTPKVEILKFFLYRSSAKKSSTRLILSFEYERPTFTTL